MFYLDNHEEKELILDETKRDLKRIIQGLTFLYQLTETQAISLLQDLLAEL